MYVQQYFVLLLWVLYINIHSAIMYDGLLILSSVCVCVQWMAVGVNGVNGRHAEPTAACGGVENVPNLRLAPVGRNARAWIFSPSTVPASNALRVSTTTSVPWLIHWLNDRLPLLITLNMMWSLGCISERPFTAGQRGKNEERAPWRLALTHFV